METREGFLEEVVLGFGFEGESIRWGIRGWEVGNGVESRDILD